MLHPSRSHSDPAPLREFLFGSAYYPEHWTEEERASDPALFHAAGWNVVRMGEFSWELIEPEHERYDFSLLDETIARFGSVGIRTILCTPTAAPPRWLSFRYPEIARVTDAGTPLVHGSRQHASQFSEIYREHSRRITGLLARRYADNSHVIGWQTDNELNCHFSSDHSSAAQRCFVQYLRARYNDDIGRLNAAWGTAFWAQSYRLFEEIDTPRPGRPAPANPSQVLDYHRFLAYGAKIFQRDQVQILRAAQPGWWISHNGCFASIDYAGDFGKDLDFLGYDSYPCFTTDPMLRRASQAFNSDYVRGLSGNFFVFEQQAGAGGQLDYLHDTPEPGEMRRMAYVNIARGADGLLLFRERTCRYGAEVYWGGILDHDNIPRRRYYEAAQLGAELARVGPAILGTSVQADVGIAAGDFDAEHGHQAISLGLASPRQTAEVVHRYFLDHGYAVACAHPGSNLEGFRVFFVPNLAVFNREWVSDWEFWVRAGGVLVVGARTGSRNSDNHAVSEPLPGPLAPLAGVGINEYGRQNRPDLRPLKIDFGNGILAASESWYELLVPEEGTEVVAHWSGRHLMGGAAITVRRLEAGAVVYVGTYFSEGLMVGLESVLLKLGSLQKPREFRAGVERVTRKSSDREIEFIINHNEHAETVPVRPGYDLISNIPCADFLTLPAGEIAAVQYTC